ncbi:MAG: hypothetical protein WC272_11295, partial [Sulfurimonas sp.]
MKKDKFSKKTSFVLIMILAASTFLLPVKGADILTVQNQANGTGRVYVNAVFQEPLLEGYSGGGYSTVPEDEVVVMGEPDSGYQVANITLDGAPQTLLNGGDNKKYIIFEATGSHSSGIYYSEIPHSVSVSIDSPTSTWYTESPTLSISYDVTGCSLDTILCDLSWYGIPPSGSHNDFEYTVP